VDAKQEKSTMELKGSHATRQVFLNKKLLSPRKSQEIWNHSPDGFNWGYGGSGPSQLALAICLKFVPKEKALKIYQNFKWQHIATLPQGDFEVVIPNPT
jgi:hypothetical protein